MLAVIAALLSGHAVAQEDTARTGLGTYVEIFNGIPNTASGAGWNLELRSGRVAMSAGVGGRYLYNREERNIYAFRDWAWGARAQLHLFGRGVDTWELAVGAGPFQDGLPTVGWGLDGDRSIAMSLYVGFRWEEPVRPFLLARAGISLCYDVLGLNLSVGWQGPSTRRTRRRTRR